MRRFALAMTIAVLFGAAPAEAQVYRWVDKDGKVHYSDKKPPDAAATDLKIESKPTDPANAEGDLEQVRASNARAEVEAEQRAEVERQRKAHDARRASQCADWRARQNVLDRVNRVVTVDAAGKETYLTDAQAEAQRAEARAKVAELCD